MVPLIQFLIGYIIFLMYHLIYVLKTYLSLLTEMLPVFSSAYVLWSPLIANSMNQDQTAPKGSGYILFASVVKEVWSAFENMQQM